jgi:hypothetical protein
MPVRSTKNRLPLPPSGWAGFVGAQIAGTLGLKVEIRSVPCRVFHVYGMKKGKIGSRAPGTPVCKQASIDGDMRRNFVIRFLFAQRFCTVVLLCFCGVHLQAAGTTGLSGSLTDPQGQVIPNATIRIWRRADSTRWETKTDAQGQFSHTSPTMPACSFGAADCFWFLQVLASEAMQLRAQPDQHRSFVVLGDCRGCVHFLPTGDR